MTFLPSFCHIGTTPIFLPMSPDRVARSSHCPLGQGRSSWRSGEAAAEDCLSPPAEEERRAEGTGGILGSRKATAFISWRKT